MSFQLAVTVTSMTTTPQFCFNNNELHPITILGQESPEEFVNVAMSSESLPVSCSNHGQRQVKTIMLSPPLPPGVGHHEFDARQQHHSVPMRKQSVFVAPSGISSIRDQRTYGLSCTTPTTTNTTLSDEDISQRIAKLIQENKAIVEANMIDNASQNYQAHHRRSFVTATSSSSIMSNYLDATYPPQCAISRRHSSNDNHHVIVQSGNPKSSYSKLQSALLGDKPTQLSDSQLYSNHYHHHNYSSDFLNNSSIGSTNFPNSTTNKNLIMRKYSQNILSWSQYGTPGPPYAAPPVVGSNDDRHSDSSCLFPSLYQQNSQQQHANKPSVIISPKDLVNHHQNGNHQEPPSSDAKSCLVRNLLLNSKPDHLNQTNSDLNSNPNNYKRTSLAAAATTTTTTTTTVITSSYSTPILDPLDASSKASSRVVLEQQTDQTSIIKDLLLKSSRPSFESSSNNEGANSLSASESHFSPRKRSRTINQELVSVRNQNIQQQVMDQPAQQQTSVHTCQLCLVQFRNEQNLEIHQKYYCCGQQVPQKQTVGTKTTRERKVSVLERPSIINYRDSSTENQSSIRQTSLISSSDESFSPCFDNKNNQSATYQESARGKEQYVTSESSYNFGNILKSKLLSNDQMETKEDNEQRYDCPRHPIVSPKQSSLKKRKISEPAFRCSSYYNPYYELAESKRESTVKHHRASFLHSSNPSCFKSFKTSCQENFPLEIIPAYMPYLMRASTKITIKGPILFSVLQNLVDTCTNHEFIVDNDTDNCNQDSPSKPSSLKFLVKQEQEVVQDEQIRSLVDDLLTQVEKQQNFDCNVISKWLTDLVDAVVEGKNMVNSGTKSDLLVPQRPTTLVLSSSWNEMNQNHDGPIIRHRKLSVLVNRCSFQEDFSKTRSAKLIPSTLVSPDTPRSKRKYQQLFLNGNAYSNLGLKVSLRPTYCCIYRLQPMFVMQEANPQLSMYSQWTTHPIPEGDVLKILKSPCQLMSAYDSQEAVFMHVHCSRQSKSLIERPSWQRQQVTIDGTMQEVKKEEESFISTRFIAEMLAKAKSRLNHMITTETLKEKPITNNARKGSIIISERTLKAAIWSCGEGFIDRIADTTTKSHFILSHSNYQQKRQNRQNLPLASNKHKSRVLFSSNSCEPRNQNSINNNMGMSSISSPMASNNNIVGLEAATGKIQCRKSSNNGSISSSTFNPYLTMHPMLGHLPSKSKQAVMYIMMMSQVQPAISVPTVPQIMSSTTKNLTSRKFSDCIGLRQKAYDPEYNWRFGHAAHDNSSGSFMPKRIKIFEGGFKSNEDYTYIRGRGRGKYICEECGIRCKKPSMLKKHIRTHTDFRPYSCRYCAFAFKTKGNLTKHMKSKAHHKRCVELGIIPVPTSIDDSQIDIEALAKQERYELNFNVSSNGSPGAPHRLSNHFADDDDEEYDDEDIEDEEDDDEGVPIPMIEQQQQQQRQTRLSYIEPGQFDDAEDSSIVKNDVIQMENCYKRKHSNSQEWVTTSPKVHCKKAGTLTANETNEINSCSVIFNHSDDRHSGSTLDDQDDCHSIVQDKKNRIISSTMSAPICTTKSNHIEKLLTNDKIMISTDNTSSPNIGSKSNISGEKNDQQINSNSQLQPLNTLVHQPQNENEAEAVRSLLILSAGANTQNRGVGQVQVEPQKNKESDLITNSHQESPSSLVQVATSLSMLKQSNYSNPTQSIVYMPEIYGYDSAMLKPVFFNPNPSDHQQSIESSMVISPPSIPETITNKLIEQQYRQSHPSVIMTNHNHQSMLNSSSEQEPNQRKRIRTNSLLNHNHPGSSCIESTIIVPSTVIGQPEMTRSCSKSLSNIHSITTMITSTTPTITVGNNAMVHQYQQPLDNGQKQPIVVGRQTQPEMVNDNLNLNSTTHRKLEKSYSNVHNNQINTNQNRLKSLDHHSVPIYHGLQSQQGSSLQLPSKLISKDVKMSIDHQHAGSPPDVRQSTSCLPTVVEQSLSRYVACNISSTINSRQNTTGLDQDEPIDLSAKKTNVSEPLLLSETTEPNLNPVSPPPLPALCNNSKKTSATIAGPYHLIEKHGQTEQIVQSLPLFDPVVSSNNVANGNRLYQSVRSKEFIHLTPGIHTPHSLPKNIQHVLMNRNDGEKRASSPISRSSSVLSTKSLPTTTNGRINNKINSKTYVGYGEGESTCPTCMKQFSKPEQLRLHFKIHSFERLFRCDPCSVSFRTKGHLQKHSRSVSHMNKLNMSITFGRPSTDNPRPFKCSDCKIAFRIHGHLAKHLRSKMHIMKLECLGKLPFGMFAEMERNNINAGLIDTTDCGKALQTLQSLAQKLYDPRQICWNKNVIIEADLKNVQHEEHDDSDLAIIEEDIENGDDYRSEGQHTNQDDHDQQDSPTTSINTFVTLPKSNGNLQQNVQSTMVAIPSTTTISSSLSGTIASIRSNTCHLCGRLFKAAKFLQVHLYCEHPEMTASTTGNNNNSSLSNDSTCKSATVTT